MKKERTRQTIADAAAQLFARHGFDAVTVADVARAADVAPRTVHRYFPDKQELLFAEDGELRDLITVTLADAPPDASGRELVEAVLGVLVAHLEGRRETAVARQRLIESSPALRARDLTKHAQIEEFVAEQLARRWEITPDTDVRPRWWAGAGMACFFSAFRVWLAEGGRLADHVDRAVRLLPPGP
jgi:AcrR family transcriptional regulator